MSPELAEVLEQVSQGIATILATWLGLVVLTRAGRQPGARVFGILTGLLVLWSVAILVQRMTLADDPVIVMRVSRAAEDVAAFLLPAATLHIALALTVEGRRSRLQRAALLVSYAVSMGMAAVAVAVPEQKWQVQAPHFELPPIPGEVFGWLWIMVRLGIFIAAVVWIVEALRQAGSDAGRRHQLQVTLATVLVGALGGALRILPQGATFDRWVGVSLITVALVLAAYAVFARGVFLSPTSAGPAFRYSMVVGAVITAYVGLALGLDLLLQRWLAVEVPLVTGLAIVVAIALFEPASGWVRRSIGARSVDESASDRLLQALGRDIITARRPEDAVAPALARLTRTFDLTGALIRAADGSIVAETGVSQADREGGLRLPLESSGTDVGEVVFAGKRSSLPLRPNETEVLHLAASYLAASLRLASKHDEQAQALTSLSSAHAHVDARRAELGEALADVSGGRRHGIDVFALGPLRAERRGSLITQWGGAKAGSRQAEAIFAFLFDRGERGAAKDEIIELIWPDIDMERADIAFHRTLNGLRSTLAPASARSRRERAVTFHHDRYRLEDAVVGWSDVDAFEALMAQSSHARNDGSILQQLEAARALYRGEYLDDCPFYGDSVHVEERRALLRARYVDVLLALGAEYERRADATAAAACFRQARSAAGEALPTADAALLRLGVSS